MNFLAVLFIWLFLPTFGTIVIAVVLSLLPIRPPKTKPGQPSWFKSREPW